MRLPRVCGVLLAGETLYGAGPVTRTRRGGQVGRHRSHADVVNLGLASGITTTGGKLVFLLDR